MFLMWPRFSAGITTTMIHATATTPASVGVNQPVRMPPSRITGIISGSAASAVANITWRSGARGLRIPAGPKKKQKIISPKPKKIAIDHQPKADHEPGHHAGHEQASDGDVADGAVDHRGDAGWHQRRDGG